MCRWITCKAHVKITCKAECRLWGPGQYIGAIAVSFCYSSTRREELQSPLTAGVAYIRVFISS